MFDYILPNGTTIGYNSAAERDADIKNRVGAITQDEALAANPGSSINDIKSSYADVYYANQPQATATPNAGPAAQPASQQNPGVMYDPAAIAGLNAGQVALGQGQTGIMANQQVLQNDIGTVGQGVGQVASSIGTPATEGQTLFGNVGAVDAKVDGLMTNFDQFGNDLTKFRGAFDTNASKTATTLNDVREQGLSQREAITKRLDTQGPMIDKINSTLKQSNPFYVGTAAAPSQSGVMSPAVTASTNNSLNNIAQSQNITMGPMGPMFVDPRDMV